MKWEEASSSGLRKWAPFLVLALVLHLGVFLLVQEQGFLTPPERRDAQPVKRVKLRTFKKPKPPENQQALAEKKDDKTKLDDELQVVNLPGPSVQKTRRSKVLGNHGSFGGKRDHQPIPDPWLSERWP